MKVRVSSSDGSKAQFDLIPAGYYSASILDIEHTTASTGTEYLRMEYEIREGPHKGRHVWGSLFLTEKSAWKTKKLLHAVGMDANGDFDTYELIGKSLKVQVRQAEDRDGNLRVEVANFKKAGAASPGTNDVLA